MSLFYLKKGRLNGLSAPEQICPITNNISGVVNLNAIDFQYFR